jgi:hypothetical protein
VLQRVFANSCKSLDDVDERAAGWINLHPPLETRV